MLDRCLFLPLDYSNGKTIPVLIGGLSSALYFLLGRPLPEAHLHVLSYEVLRGIFPDGLADIPKVAVLCGLLNGYGCSCGGLGSVVGAAHLSQQ